jgi:NADPH:quinone reductase-like Zn-dependent oxidoreductase
MHAAILNAIGEPPSYGTFQNPSPSAGQEIVRVLAAGVNHLDLAKATGKFYTGPPPIPSVVGSDGVGVTADGRRVFFDAPVPPYGSWAEESLVSAADLFEFADGLSDAAAAALGNTGLAAWLALDWRAQLKPGENVLVLAASGALGNVAVQAARILGAGRVVAADRRPERLAHLDSADATVVLDDGTDLVDRFRAASPSGYDVIIDPLWGAPAAAAMQAAARGARHVQVGHLAGVDIVLPAPVIRSAAIDVRGMAAFHASREVRQAAFLALTEHAASGQLTVNLEEFPLSQVQEAWRRQSNGPGTKLVLIP